jgi:L-asparagine transporter-like permease
MENIYFLKILKSRYCLVVFFLMAAVSYVLIPKKIFYGFYNLIAFAFIVIFALTFTCLIRSIKDRIVAHKKQTTKPIWGALIGLIGLSALQTCAVGAPVCGASVGLAIVSAVFPTLAFDFINDYSLAVIVFSILIQIVSLYQMRCFKNIKNASCE